VKLDYSYKEQRFFKPHQEHKQQTCHSDEGGTLNIGFLNTKSLDS
jgi:hypothetical protein